MKAQQDKKSVLNPGCFTAFDSVTNEHTDKFLIQCENQSDLYLYELQLYNFPVENQGQFFMYIQILLLFFIRPVVKYQQNSLACSAKLFFSRDKEIITVHWE